MKDKSGYWVVAAVGTLFLIVGNDPAWTASPTRDPEIRCCFSNSELRNEFKGVFLIELRGYDHPIGHLKLVTPKGTVIGYDERTKDFSRPLPEGVYGLGPPDGMSMIDPSWNNSTPRTLALFKRYKGDYKLYVIGEREGRYVLNFLVGGPPQTGPGAKTSLADRSLEATIRAGEVHAYVFPGEFDDIYDGSLSPSSPTRFRVERLVTSK